MLGIALERPLHPGGDPAAVEAAGLGRHQLSVNPAAIRFASINCYHFCLSPGNTGILPSSDLASSVRSAPAEFARTTSHRVAQGYRTTTGIDPGPGGSPGPRGPWWERPHWAGPASDPARGPAASKQRTDPDFSDLLPYPLRLDFIALRLTAACHLRLDAPQPVPAQTPLQRPHLPVAVALRIMGHQPLHQRP